MSGFVPPELYLSTLQSSLEASAVFVLSVFPVLNYASEALPISSRGKGEKTNFFENLTSSCHHCLSSQKDVYS